MTNAALNARLLDLLACPDCAAGLRASAETLSCTGCSREFPIAAGIPRFVPADNYAATFGFQWNRFRQTQLDSRSGLHVSRDRFFRQTGWTPESLRDRTVLDVGCGAGRFAEIALSCGALVVALDYSSAIDACAQNLSESGTLLPVQGDIYHLPFKPGAFDFVYCLGVVQHTPDVRKAVHSLVPPLADGGRLAVDVYMRNLARWSHPRTWLRPLTTHVDKNRLFRWIERAAPLLLSTSGAVGRIPAAGRYMRRLVPIANYEGVYPLTREQLLEWAVLDTYDWLSPRYDRPQTGATLERWLREAGLDDVEVFRADHLTGRGCRRRTNTDGHPDKDGRCA